MSEVTEEIIDEPLDFDGTDGANERENESFNSVFEEKGQSGQSNRVQKFKNAQQKTMEETRELRGSRGRSVSFTNNMKLNGTKANRKRSRKNRKTRKNRKGSRKNL